MNRRRQIYEGKAKILYEGPEPGTIIQYFKDDATAFNAQKKGTISGKGVLNNRISEHVFTLLGMIGIPTHFIRRLNMREQLVRQVEIIPIEVVVRNVAAGSISKRLGIPEGEAMDRLWQAIFACTKADLPDPIAAWEQHNADLGRRTEFMNKRRYRALKYKGPGTDLMLGLAADHTWKGGGGKALNGVFCNANIPTEEVFTAPHKDMVDGIVCSSKPLSYQGSLIDGIKVRFERGKIMLTEIGRDTASQIIAGRTREAV